MVMNVKKSALPFFFSSRRRHTRLQADWSSDVCSSDLVGGGLIDGDRAGVGGGIGDLAGVEGESGELLRRGGLGWHGITPVVGLLYECIEIEGNKENGSLSLRTLSRLEAWFDCGLAHQTLSTRAQGAAT